MKGALRAMIETKGAIDERDRAAVELALAGSWSEAADLNREVLRDRPGDVEAHNRLGKALMELGSTDEAIGAFERALALSPHNRIARRNLDRISSRRGIGAARRGAGAEERARVREETGKSAVVPLVNIAGPAALSRLMPGDPVDLVPSGSVVKAVSDGARIGQVEPRLGARICRLMSGGNRYSARVRDLSAGGASLLIREVYKHPSQMATVSFPDRKASAPVRHAPAVRAMGAWEADDGRAAMSMLKDWTDDDTEPGDDDAFAPVVHRVISSADPDAGL